MRHIHARDVSIAAAALAVFTLCRAALAFDSYGSVTAEHGQITRDAATAKGWDASGISYLQKFNRGVDWLETSTKRDGLLSLPYLAPNEHYHYTHHFDRGKDGPNFRDPYVVLLNSGSYVRSQITAARDAANTDKPKEALEALGRGLHAIQDLASHSNLIDLKEADRNKLIDEVFGLDVNPLPPSLHITSYVTTKETEFPKGDPYNYTHGARAKDNAKKNDEAKSVPDGGTSTKFELAFALGKSMSERLLDAFAKDLPGGKFNAVHQYASADPPPGSEMYQFAAVGQFTPGAPINISANGSTLSFGEGSFASPTEVAILGAPLNVFRETSELFAPDGRFMGILREINPLDTPILSPGQASVEFLLSDIPFLLPNSLQIYYLDPVEHSWTYASGSSLVVNLDGTGIAQFAVPATGVYAIGGFATVPEPPLVNSLFAIAVLAASRRRRHAIA